MGWQDKRGCGTEHAFNSFFEIDSVQVYPNPAAKKFKN